MAKPQTKLGPIDKAKKDKLDLEIVQLTMKLAQLSSQKAGVSKKLQKVVKERKDNFGDEGLPEVDMEQIQEEAEADKDTE